jgi:hypothetical protein
MRQTLRAQEWPALPVEGVTAMQDLVAAIRKAMTRAEEYASGFERVGGPRLIIAVEIDVEVPDGCKPGMVGCRQGCGHRELVEAYRAERARLLAAAEAASKGYASERAEHLREHPLPTFGSWLRWTRRRDVAA